MGTKKASVSGEAVTELLWPATWPTPLTAGNFINRYGSGGSRTCSQQTLNLIERRPQSLIPAPFLLSLRRSYLAGVRRAIQRQLSHSFHLFHPLPIWIAAWASDKLLASKRCITSRTEALSVTHWLKINRRGKKNRWALVSMLHRTMQICDSCCAKQIRREREWKKEEERVWAALKRNLDVLYWGGFSQWF